MTRFVVWMFAVGMMVPGVAMVSGQNYPNRPIRIVTSDVGGGNDIAARIIAQGITGSLGQQVIVENRGGASGLIAIETVTKASPDGYTVLFYGSAMWINPLLQKTSYDPLADFSPITLATMAPNILVVHPALPVKSVQELVAMAKAKPGELNYASSATGGSSHLAAELFKSLAGVNLVRISYKGNGPALNDVIGGQVQLIFSNATGVMPHIKSGRLRPLAVTSAKPSALLPNLPTVAATVPGYESVSVFGMFAPAKTPKAVIIRLNQETVRVLNRADVKEMFGTAGVETVGSTPEQLAVKVKDETDRVSKLVKSIGIRAD